MRIRNGLGNLTTHAPYLRLIEGDGGAGGTGTATEDKPGDKPGEDKGGDGDKPDAGKTYTADDVSRLIEQRVGELTRRHKAETDALREDKDKDANGRLEAERDRATAAKDAAIQKAAPKVAQALAQVAAIAAGGRPDRAAAIVRQADLDGVAKFEGDDWTVDETKIGEALAKVLDEYPEWKAEAGDAGKGKGDEGDKGGDQGKGSRSGGDLGGGTGGSELTLDQFTAMGMAARTELRAKDPEQYRDLADKEIAAKGQQSRR